MYATSYYDPKFKNLATSYYESNNKINPGIKPRKATVEIEYNGKNISTSLENYLKTFSYIDINTGESDSISIAIGDMDRNWINGWFPTKGDKLSVKIIYENWEKENTKEVFNCGTFILDDLSFSGWPISGDLGAVSAPANSNFKETKRTKTWEAVTLRQIAQEIANNSKVNMYYEDTNDITIKSIEQNEQTDSEFLVSLCKDYGMAIKIYSNRITLFNEYNYECKDAKCDIMANEIQSWTYNTTLSGTYTGGKIKYTDPKTKKDVKVDIGTGPRILEVNEKCDSYFDAQTKIKNKINEANKQLTTMSITIMAKRGLIASDCVNIVGLGKLDGKYYIEKIIHSIGDKYTMQLELRFVVNRIGEESTGMNLIAKFQKNALADGYSVKETGVWDSQTQSLAKRAIVKYGTRGNLAKFVQTLLIQKGYKLPLYGADGIVGSETLSQINAYKASNGLSKDGTINLEVWKKLLSV